MSSDFYQLLDLMNRQKIIYNDLLKEISDICKNRSFTDYQKVKEIERIADAFDVFKGA